MTERDSIMEQARQNVDRLKDFQIEQRDDAHDPLARWAAGMPKAEPAKKRVDPPLQQPEPEPDWSGWNAWADAKIENAIAVERAILTEVVAKLLRRISKLERMVAQQGSKDADVVELRKSA
jgi:hypothetical protein